MCSGKSQREKQSDIKIKTDRKRKRKRKRDREKEPSHQIQPPSQFTDHDFLKELNGAIDGNTWLQ